MRKSKNRNFYHIFVSPGDAPRAITLCCMDGKRTRCLQIVSLHVPIYLLPFLRYSEIFCEKVVILSYPLAFDAPVRGVPVWISAPPWGGKIEWCRYPMVKKFRRYLYSFWRDPRTWRTDRRTNGQTLRDSKDCACIASRGKNWMQCFVFVSS